MKKVLALVLVIILSLSLLTACFGGGRGGGAGDEKGTELAKKLIDASGLGSEEQREQAKGFVDTVERGGNWPADKLPEGFPVYPDGEPMTIPGDGSATIVAIMNTSRDVAMAYIETLKGAGWTFTQNEASEQFHVYEANKDGWEIKVIATYESRITLSITPPPKE